jgi:hypothetical protein
LYRWACKGRVLLLLLLLLLLVVVGCLCSSISSTSCVKGCAAPAELACSSATKQPAAAGTVSRLCHQSLLLLLLLQEAGCCHCCRLNTHGTSRTNAAISASATPACMHLLRLHAAKLCRC